MIRFTNVSENNIIYSCNTNLQTGHCSLAHNFQVFCDMGRNLTGRAAAKGDGGWTLLLYHPQGAPTQGDLDDLQVSHDHLVNGNTSYFLGE